MKKLAALLIVLSICDGRAAPQCAVDAQPKLSQAPLRYMRLKVTVEPQEDPVRGATVALVDQDGEVVRSSFLDMPPRTSWLEWRSIVVGPGEYVVVVMTTTQCRATQQITVAGQ